MAEALSETNPNPDGVGQAVDRYEGRLKVTGAAPYAYEPQDLGRAAYGVIVPAAIAKGRVATIDLSQARAAPGVLLAWSHENAPEQPAMGARSTPDSQSGARPVLGDDRIAYFGAPIAFVVAETLEQAQAAARLVTARYAPGDALVDFAANADQASAPRGEGEARTGDFEAAFAAAPVTVDATWTTPVQNHCQIEPHASFAAWDDDKLTLHNANQFLKGPQHAAAETLQIPRQNVRVLSRYIGGGFGGKASLFADGTLAALATRALGRPVKVAFTRQQMFHMATHRPASIQRVRLGATPDGVLTAIAHEGVVHCARDDSFVEHVAANTRGLYAAPNRLTGHKLLRLDIPVAGAMRAPGEAIGMLAIEGAMDELAEKLAIDPVELRIRNEPEAHPENGAAFSSRDLVACLREGAARFGWARRNPKPGQTRDGDWLIGMGMAASIRGNFLLPARAYARIDADGVVTMRQGMTDIGTGSYTILAQIVSETLGVPISHIKVELGDSAFAPAPGSGGSFGAASAGSAVLDAGRALGRKLADLAVADPRSPLHGGDPARAAFRDGAISIENRSEALADLVARAAPAGVEADGRNVPDAAGRNFAQACHGAHFVEVAVDRITGETRVRRMLGVFAAGRILNPKTARSQMLGGMIWGVGTALHEQNHIDPRYGSFVNQDLATYQVPVHADIADLEAIFLPQRDDIANPLGIKGIGELGICGAGAAIANAIYNACGARIRDYPITMDKLLPFLPPV
jgi:xanthine dehydrogenase YagR molybdenum-binding subunit